MSDNEKTQPQELLEEVIGITHGDKPQFPRSPMEAEVTAALAELQFTCPKCLRRFKSPQAVAMHKARVHDKTIDPNKNRHRKYKWSLARRRRYNAKKKMLAISTGPLSSPWHEVPPPPQEPVAMIKHCPFCGKNVERFLA